MSYSVEVQRMIIYPNGAVCDISGTSSDTALFIYTVPTGKELTIVDWGVLIMNEAIGATGGEVWSLEIDTVEQAKTVTSVALDAIGKERCAGITTPVDVAAGSTIELLLKTTVSEAGNAVFVLYFQQKP